MSTRPTLWKVDTAKTLLNTGGTGTFTGSSVANNAGRLSARIDMGAYPRPILWRWYAETQLQASTPVVGATVDFYLVTWDDETTPGRGQGGITTATDSAFSTENDLLNLGGPFGSIRVRSTSADVLHSNSGILIIPTRYISVVMWNRSGATTTADATEHSIRFTPYIPEAQAEV